MPQYCILGETFPISRSCVPCKGYGDGFIQGTSLVQQEYCTACQGYTSTQGCFLSDSCQKGTQFRSNEITDIWHPIFCTSCDYTDKINIGSTEGHRNMCTACTTTKRFWTGSYCYRCDTRETPDVTTQDEIKNCTEICGRKVENGKCVLNQ